MQLAWVLVLAAAAAGAPAAVRVGAADPCRAYATQEQCDDESPAKLHCLVGKKKSA